MILGLDGPGQKPSRELRSVLSLQEPIGAGAARPMHPRRRLTTPYFPNKIEKNVSRSDRPYPRAHVRADATLTVLAD